MAMTKQEIIEWLDSLEDDDLVYIDDGGLALCVVGMEGVYIEVGGYTEDEDEEDNRLWEGRV